MRTVKAQEWSGDTLQIFRIGKKTLVVNHSRCKRTRPGYRVKRQAAAHAKAKNRNVFLADPRQFTKVGNAINNFLYRSRNIQRSFLQRALIESIENLTVEKIRG